MWWLRRIPTKIHIHAIQSSVYVKRNQAIGCTRCSFCTIHPGPKAREYQKHEIDKMLKLKVTGSTETGCAFPSAIDPKKEDSFRLVSITENECCSWHWHVLNSMHGRLHWLVRRCKNLPLFWRKQQPLSSRKHRRRPRRNGIDVRPGCFCFPRIAIGRNSAPNSFQPAMEVIFLSGMWPFRNFDLEDIQMLSRTASTLTDTWVKYRHWHMSKTSNFNSKCANFQEKVHNLCHVLVRHASKGYAI